MPLNINWGPQAINAGFGSIQSVEVLVDALLRGEDTEITSSGLTSVSLSTTINELPVTVQIDGVGLLVDEGTDRVIAGAIDTIQFFSGTSASDGQSIATLTAPINAIDLNAAAEDEDAGNDPGAIENYLASFDWTYNGNITQDVLPEGALSQDGATYPLNGDDRVVLAGGDDNFYAAGGDDVVRGGPGDDAVVGGSGDDVLFGGTGMDNLAGAAGDDRLLGGDQEDALNGNGGNDTLYGGNGFDAVDGGAGDDIVDGGAQADNLGGGTGNDTLRGGEGLDRLFGNEGDDFGRGGSSVDGLFGQQGNDRLFGEADDDRALGGSGNDFINGGTGDDFLYGNAGFDTLLGGTGNDILQGDFNADEFAFVDGHGDDLITDFEATNDLERINLRNISEIDGFDDLMNNHTSQVGTDVVIDTGNGNSVTLSGVDMADLDQADFIL